MQLKADLDFEDDLFIIPLSFSSTRLKKKASIDFIVDTGCSITTINDKDARRLEIPYDELPPSEERYYGFGGTSVTTYELKECKLLYRDKETDEKYSFELDHVIISKHDYQSEEEERMMFLFRSLLGLDILKRFNMRFSNYTLFLEN